MKGKNKKRLYTLKEMKQFKADTELFSQTKFRKKWGSKLTYKEMEDKWIEKNS